MNSPAESNFWIGRCLGDRQRYRLEKRLGGGGMGDVFLAMDTRMGKQVALKLLKGTLVSFQEMKKRFEREVEISAALHSEHIVQVTDYGMTDEGYPFYVMEYLRGESLRQLLQRERRLLATRSVKIITQICHGLQHAHKGVTLWREAGTISEHIQVIHRDLKPDNIFLETTDSREVVKIVDFGIAKIRSESYEQTNLTHTFIGTFRYASPEQLRGEDNLDGRADIYSLGIILYEMLSATDPFGFSMKRNFSESSWIFAHTSEPPQPLRQQLGCEHLSVELEAVVMRCLQKQPSDRFTSVAELNQALQGTIRPTIHPPSRQMVKETIPLVQPELAQSYDAETIINPPKPVNLKIEALAPIVPPDYLQLTPKKEDAIIQYRSPIQVIPQRRTQLEAATKSELSLKPTMFTALIVIACISGFFAYPLITSLLTLKSIQDAQAQSNYEECIALAEKVNSGYSIYQQVTDILNKCRFGYATKLAEENKCNEAMQTIEKIPPENSTFTQARIEIDHSCIKLFK
ncbi:serine/threonine protein kinase [Fortiea contorta]|uniref:serine/threonine protein kinase n=1 Tax=Fortiea contorta TaxID=1892405 RepID=UPI000345E6BB|nr:serine/threonine-protein kinase [Fortiea contorta]